MAQLGEIKMPILRYRIEATVNQEEWKRIEKFCKQNKISIYALVKEAVLEKVKKD